MNKPSCKNTNRHHARRMLLGGMLGALLALSPGATPLSAAPGPIPNLNKGAPASAANPAESSSFTDLGALESDSRKQLDEARQDLSHLLAHANEQASNDATSQSNNAMRRFQLEMLIRIYEAQLARISELNALQRQNAAMQQQAASMMENALPPASFIAQDQLRDSLGILDKRIAELQEIAAIFEPEIQRRLGVNEESAAKLRQVDEELAKTASDTAAQTPLRVQRSVLMLQNRIDAAHLFNAEIEKQLTAQRILEAQLKREAIAKQTAVAVSYDQLTAQDIKTAQANLESQRQAILAELDKTLAERDAEQRREATLKNLPEAPPQAVDTVRYVQRENEDIKLQALSLILQNLQFQQFYWEQRLSYAHVFDREKAREAYDRIIKSQTAVRVTRDYIERKRRLALDLIAAQVNDERNANTSSTAERSGDLHAAYIERIVTISRVLATLDTTDNLLHRWKQDLDERFQVKTLSDRLTEFWLAARTIAQSAWQYEILAAQDITDVDGRKITLQRSITVAKIGTALIILVFGYWFASKLALLTELFAVKRFGIDLSMARIARRWILFVAFLILLTVSLTVVHIPLTVFAFMGGAVAIGAGFGMQNLLKNLISGLMLIVERPFRPGDLVEVGDIRGRITDIGVRSSHIRDANGIETLIPNSKFIEEQVTNWTLSNQLVPINIKIGVDYASPVEEVTDLLLEAGARHGLVQDKPPPQVLFEDFGDNALLFGLYVWVEIKPEVDWRTVASDLRYMINKTFNAKGISIAYPQRDVHLDTLKPLEVRVLAKP